MKRLITLLFLFIGFSSWGQKGININKKIYEVLTKEMTAAENLIKIQKTGRNYFRYYNSRVEIIKFRSQSIRSKKFNNKLGKSTTQKIDKKQFDFYKQTRKIGDYILRKYPKFSERGKVHLIQGLLIYQFEEDSPQIETHFLNAVKQNREKNLKGLSASKLADYYFNKKKYREASVYFAQALKLNSTFHNRDRIHYNLALAEFKQNKFDYAIRNLEAVFYRSKQKNTKNFYYMQSKKLIPEFYTFSGKPERGFIFLVKHNDNVENYISYLRYTYSKGFFEKYNEYVKRLESRLISQNKQADLKKFRLEIYQMLVSSEYKKNQKTLMDLRKSLVGYSVSGKLSKNEKSDFKNSNLKLLQRNIDKINFQSQVGKSAYSQPLLADTSNLLTTLAQIDPSNKDSYELRKGQLFSKLGKEKTAYRYLQRSYESLKAKGKKNQAGKVLGEIVAYYDKNKEDPSAEKYFREYIQFGGDQRTKQIVYLKLYDIYYDKKLYGKSFDLTKQFHKKYPRNSKQTESMLLKLLGNEDFVKTATFAKVKSFINNDKILYKLPELAKGLNSNYRISVVKEINEMSRKENEPSLKNAQKLMAYFNDSKLDRRNRLIAGFNAASIYRKLGKVKKSLPIFKSVLQQSDLQEFQQYEESVEDFTAAYVVSHLRETMDLQSYLFKKSCQFKTLKRSEHFSRLVELLLYGSFHQRLDKILQLGARCDLDGEGVERLLSLYNEYLDFNKESELAVLIQILAKSRLTSQEKNFEFVHKFLTFKLNTLSSFENSDYYSILHSIDKNFAVLNVKNSNFRRNLQTLLSVGMQPHNYFSMSVNGDSLEKYLDSNLAVFTKKLKVIRGLEVKYPAVAYLSKLIEVDAFEHFLTFMDNTENLIQAEPNEKREVLSVVNGALGEFKTSLVDAKSSLVGFRIDGVKSRLESFRIPSIDLIRREDYVFQN